MEDDLDVVINCNLKKPYEMDPKEVYELRGQN